MPRFTISLHTGAKEGDHYDLFLEQGRSLKTWRFRSPAFQAVQSSERIKDHRPDYLDFEGEITGGRGRVEIWDTGTYEADEWTDARIRIAATGRRIRLRLRLERDGETRHRTASPWLLYDAAGELRRAAAAFLRDVTLDAAPNAELEGLREGLVIEERALMASVEQYARAAAVDWAKTKTDASLRKAIRTEKARWQHPWLAAAQAYAKKLDQLAALFREARPKT